ncbi:MAG: PDZ domain-containing protein [Candidatus Glassbacteria bacterium]
MNCEEVYIDFSGYLDGNLPKKRISEIEAHIKGCEGCHTYSKILSEGIRTYRSRPEVKLPDDFYGRLEHSIYRLEEEERLKRSHSTVRTFVRTLSPAISAGFAFAGFLYFFTARAPQQQVADNPASLAPSARVVRPATYQNEPFALSRFLEEFVDDYIDERLTPLRSSLGGIPVSVADPAYATFVSEDPSFSPYAEPQSTTNALIRTSMGFAAIPARMERPLSKLTKSEDGLLVVDVQFMSKAFVAGLRKGDVIISLDEKPIENVRSLFRKVLNNKKRAREMRVVRNGKVVDLKID